MRMREMCYAKIHFATVTATKLKYNGSVTIDKALLKLADMLPGEKVGLLNAANGARVETYIIEGKQNSGIVCVNGPAARLFQVGDKVVIISYAWMDEKDARQWTPVIIHVDETNHPLPSAKRRR